MTGSYINDPGNEVPKNKILLIPHNINEEINIDDYIVPLKNEKKRDWFTSHFYYCLPLNIGNQHGFAVKSLFDFTATWGGGEQPAKINILNGNGKQHISNHFGSGIITFQNIFSIKTSPGINIMTIQTPNYFIPGTVAMTGVVETDQIRRDFTFNLKITIPNYEVSIKKGDWIGAFIPYPRYFIDDFSVDNAENYFDKSLVQSEIKDAGRLGKERETVDSKKPHGSGRRYFNGLHIDGSKYKDHQKRLK